MSTWPLNEIQFDLEYTINNLLILFLYIITEQIMKLSLLDEHKELFIYIMYSYYSYICRNIAIENGTDEDME